MILDGYGLNKNCDHNAVCEAKTPIMDQLMSQCPSTWKDRPAEWQWDFRKARWEILK